MNAFDFEIGDEFIDGKERIFKIVAREYTSKGYEYFIMEIANEQNCGWVNEIELHFTTRRIIKEGEQK